MRLVRLLMCVFGIGLMVAPMAGSAGVAPPGGHWPQWRGPQRDGISTETGLLARWPAAGPPVAFAVPGLGIGFSSVSIANGRIFTMGDLSNGQHVIALDEETGRRLWATRLGGRHVDEYGGPRGTPTIDGELLYAVDTDGDLVCLETATGRERWRKSLPREFGAPMPGWMFAESPLVDGDRVLVAPGTRRAAMVAFNKTTGAELWRTAMPDIGSAGLDGPEYSSIVISNAAGIKQYVRLIGRGVIGVRASDGAFLWGYNRVANPTANIPTPIVKGNFVFVSTGYADGGAALLEITAQPGGKATATEKYYLRPGVFQNHHGGMILIGDYLYAGKGHNAGFPICLELATGRVVWGGNIRNAGQGSAAVTAAEGNLYFRYQNGVMLLIEASPRGYVEKGSFQIPNVRNPSWSHPVIAAGRLYLREQDTLNVYKLK